MCLYFVVFHDGAFQYIEGYDYSLEHGHAVFDKGHGEISEFYGVEYVQNKGLIA